MKKILILCFLLLFAGTAGAADKPEVFSFRGLEFGMTQEQVLSIETAEMLNDPSWPYFQYKLENMYGLEGFYRCFFSDGSKLFNGIWVVLFIPKTDDFKRKYNEILADLVEKYKANDDKPIYSLTERDLTDLGLWYLIKNEERFISSFLVFLRSIEHNERMIWITFIPMDSTDAKNLLDRYKGEFKPVKQKDLNKIIGK